jgi:hypothetical protein
MLSINDYVNKKNTQHPTGIIEVIDEESGMAMIRWGIADGRIYKTNLPLDQLQKVEHEILSPEDVQLKEIEKQEVKRHNIFENKEKGQQW